MSSRKCVGSFKWPLHTPSATEDAANEPEIGEERDEQVQSVANHMSALGRRGTDSASDTARMEATTDLFVVSVFNFFSDDFWRRRLWSVSSSSPIVGRRSRHHESTCEDGDFGR